MTCYVNLPHILVRISLARDRYHEAEKELIQIAGPGAAGPMRQGSWSELTWGFVRREDADLFKVNAENIPGVLAVQMT